MKPFQIFLALLAVMLAALISVKLGPVVALVLLTVFSLAVNPAKARLCTVTLSVPEILMDVLDAFKFETPILFGPDGFATDHSSKTAVLGDKITARISHVPTVQDYDNTPGPGHGFYGGAQNVTTLIEDVPVTLDRLSHVPIKVGWLTQLSSKLPLYKEAVRNIGYALGKKVVDTAIEQLRVNFSNSIALPPVLTNLDSLENVRTQLNSQKAFGKGRFGFVNSSVADAISADDRSRSSLFYGELNGAEGYRRWKNMAGCSWIQEKPDIADRLGPFIGFFGDRRAVTVATRQVDFSNAAEELGVPQVMEFYPIADAESGIFLTGVGWQEQGTGDMYVSAAVLYGVSAGTQGGAPGACTDNAGLLVRAS